MKTRTILFSLIATASLALAQAPNSTPRRGPEIIVDRASRDIFPESWLTERINATADALSAEAQQRGREIIRRRILFP